MATGIDAASSYLYGYGSFDGTTSVQNSGNISLEAPYASFGKAVGISATREIGNVVVGNSGDIDIYAGGRSYGIDAFTKYGDVAVTNSGDITMESPTDAVIGMMARSMPLMITGGSSAIRFTGEVAMRRTGAAVRTGAGLAKLLVGAALLATAGAAAGAGL